MNRVVVEDFRQGVERLLQLPADYIEHKHLQDTALEATAVSKRAEGVPPSPCGRPKYSFQRAVSPKYSI